ncbi:MAG: YkgJ family cysteine cluster protein [Proteobacteria bacterium]|nr:YkgJ family cysteine cluster protein [Pseudomonadota bacterium]MBU4413732.1 YkgJ family cysteine cluster protein [Pseudomonadota bacterium]
MIKTDSKNHIIPDSSLSIKSDNSISECKRCGTCCKKGGPCFHIEDKMLIEKGLILIKYLYTIRKGELAYDNIKGHLTTVTSDLIKIKSQNDSWECIFFDENDNSCKIYDTKPVECRALKCWDTREIEEIYFKNRLTRKDLVCRIEGLWDLIEDHQSRCSYDKIKHFVKELNGEKNKEAIEGIYDILLYDDSIRELVVKKGKMDPENLEFLFGRPIVTTIRMFGLKVEKKNDKYYLLPQ